MVQLQLQRTDKICLEHERGFPMDRRLKDCLEHTRFDYIAPFLWLHGEERDKIFSELHRIYESGMRSVCLESRTHEEFCREGWWKDVRAILDECKRLGMKLWILDDKHFPSGYANGIFEEKYKELQPFGITEYHVDIAGPAEDCAVLADGWAGPEDEILAVLACRHIPSSEVLTGEVMDITAGLDSGMVYFTLPEGMWRIIFLIKTQRGMAPHTRCFSDKLNPLATRRYIEEVYEPHYKHFKDEFGKTFLGFFSDEACFHNNSIHPEIPTTGRPFVHFPWHSSVGEQLAECYGKDFYKKLAGIWFDFDNGLSEEIRIKYMDIVSRAYQNCYSDPIAEWCHSHGVMYIGHIIEDNHLHAATGGGPGHYFRALANMDMAGVDVVLHQIIPGLSECNNAGCVSYKHMECNFFHYYLAKLGSSLAHIDPQKKGRAMCEIFGAYGWGESIKTMKYLADHMLVRGINYFVPHAFSPKLNDADCPPNFYDSGRNPQYQHFKKIIDYMNRCCHMLSGGEPDIRCALLYDAEAHWANGNFVPLENCAKVLYDHQLDYDIVPFDEVERVQGKYSLLIVPWADSMPDPMKKELIHLQTEVVFAVSQKGEAALGKSVEVDALPDYATGLGLRDVEVSPETPSLKYRHYKREEADIYMFVNEDISHTVSGKMRLSSFTGGSYVEYDPMENTAVRKTAEDAISLVLPPYHSVMVIFGQIGCGHLPQERRLFITDEMAFAPEFQICIKREEEEEYQLYKTSQRLFNLTGRGELPYFSGEIQYRAVFHLPEDGNYLLNLGRVGETADVMVNGKRAGTKILPPYEFDISDLVHKGENTLCITVSNTNVFERRDAFSKYLLLEPSGLLGPLTLQRYEKN